MNLYINAGSLVVFYLGRFHCTWVWVGFLQEMCLVRTTFISGGSRGGAPGAVGPTISQINLPFSTKNNIPAGSACTTLAAIASQKVQTTVSLQLVLDYDRLSMWFTPHFQIRYPPLIYVYVYEMYSHML